MSEVTSGNLVGGAATVVWPDRYQYVTIENNDGSSGLWVTADGSPAVIGGPDVNVIPPGGTTLLANGAGWWHQGSPGFDGTMISPGTIINLASESATAAYSVSAAG